MILSADEKRMALEFEIFSEINSLIAARSKELQVTAAAIGELDVIANLAEIAVNNRYTRPESERELQYPYPRREASCRREVACGFVPNDTTWTARSTSSCS